MDATLSTTRRPATQRRESGAPPRRQCDSAESSQSAGADILALVPKPNAVDPGGSPFRNNLVGGGSNTFNANNWDTRWDWFASEKQSIFGRYSNQQFDQLAPAAFGLQAGGPALQGNRFSGSSEARNQSLAFSVTRAPLARPW